MKTRLQELAETSQEVNGLCHDYCQSMSCNPACNCMHLTSKCAGNIVSMECCRLHTMLLTEVHQGRTRLQKGNRWLNGLSSIEMGNS